MEHNAVKGRRLFSFIKSGAIGIYKKASPPGYNLVLVHAAVGRIEMSSDHAR
jgi:hypothetical protein